MRTAHQVAKVRAAEQALMAQLPPGTLMQRAAAGLAAVCAGLAGQVSGTRVVVLAGSGDNGGDALYAGARLARRGAAVLAVQGGSRLHEAGAAALRAAGGRVAAAGDPAVPAAVGSARLILDGLLGIGGHGRPARAAGHPGRAGQRARPRSWWPWTCRVAWTRIPAPCRARRYRPT